MTSTRANRAALLSMLAGAALIGTNAMMVRAAQVPPTVSAFWRMLFAGAMLVLLLRTTGRWQKLPKHVWLWALLPATAFACDLWLWHRSILLIGPGLATLLGNAQVFFMALAGVLLFRERLGPRFVGGIVLAFVGLWLLLGEGWSTLPPQYRWGVWLGLGTGVCYAIYNITLRTAQQHARDASHGPAPVMQVLAIASLASAVLLGLMGFAEGASFAIPTWQSLGVLLVLALVGHCLSWGLISRAMPQLSVALIGLLLLLQPIVAFLLEVWLLDRATSPREWAGLLVSLAGIFLAGLKGRERLPEQPT